MVLVDLDEEVSQTTSDHDVQSKEMPFEDHEPKVSFGTEEQQPKSTATTLLVGTLEATIMKGKENEHEVEHDDDLIAKAETTNPDDTVISLQSITEEHDETSTVSSLGNEENHEPLEKDKDKQEPIDSDTDQSGATDTSPSNHNNNNNNIVQKKKKTRTPVRFDIASHDDDSDSLRKQGGRMPSSSSRPKLLGRPGLQRSAGRHKSASRDITVAIRTVNKLQLVDLIKTLYAMESAIVTASLMQLHAMIDEDALDATQEPDNSLELGVFRRGGHLALLRALQNHVHQAAIHAMGWAALAWLCERTNIKGSLVSQGALPLALTALQYHGVVQPDWSVVTEALYFVGHLSTIPKVAQQVRFRETALWEELVPRLRFAYKEGQHDAAETAVDAFLFCSLHWAHHRSLEIVRGVWQAGSLRFVVCLMQEALVYWQAAHNAGIDESCAAYEDRLVTGLRILTHWAKTPEPIVVHALIEAGALTVAAEVLRLFPAGSNLRKAANPCLRAMVPATED